VQVDKTKETTYYDSVTGKALFIAPRGRTFDEFLKESKVHGWPSFRDQVFRKKTNSQIQMLNDIAKQNTHKKTRTIKTTKYAQKRRDKAYEIYVQKGKRKC
jgi:exonuclease I